MNIKSRSVRLAALAAAWLAATATAEVTRIDVTSRGEIAEGQRYGVAGAYEKVAGTMHFAIDPDTDVNRIVRDIAHAPRTGTGAVEFSTDFFLIKPSDAERGNGTLLFDVANRGRKLMLSRFNHADGSLDPESTADFGDGFLQRHGFSVIWVGWQFDVPDADDLMRVTVPAADAGGAPVRGLVRSDFIVRERVPSHTLADGDHIAYPVADPDNEANTLTVRDSPAGERHRIARTQWGFGRLDGERIVPDPGMVYLRGGFEPHRIYEVVYESENPPIAGLGLAAIRDAISKLKHDGAAELGVSAETFERAIAFGSSQSGRLLRTFLYDGFNEDERQRKVFDGAIPHIAGGARGSFNHRFAQPSRASWSYFYPNALFPFTSGIQTDLPMERNECEGCPPGIDITTGADDRIATQGGESDGLLARIDPEFMPKVFYTNSSNEYWRASAALTHISADATDVTLLDNERIYLFAGTQHGPAGFPPRVGQGQLPGNPNDYSWFLRALLIALDEWIADGVEPPPSSYPTLADGTLTPLGYLAFPDIPGVATPASINPVQSLDFGPRFRTEGIATIEPPEVGPTYPVRLPQVDADGNETAGLRSPELAVPLATYTGWSLFDPAFGPAHELVSLQGSYLPFAASRAEREQRQDPRSAILERYGSRDAYLGRLTRYSVGLVDQGYLLAEDMPEIVRRAAVHWDALVATDQ
ncbi:alpha/beta hydrolase domain-containing protein [Candidatus Rariloculus sp.]|uniref:alpha/beta hydrolase domain-containing protein n=1 Tax=Candidatus Rariloculus sp. TaxID=3101265 RepID=UPI003D1219EA